MVKGLESQDISEVKMSSGKDKAEDEEDLEDEEITIKNDVYISTAEDATEIGYGATLGEPEQD